LLAGCVLTAQVTIGCHVVAMPQVTMTHDDVVSDFATLCAAVTLGGSVHIGEAAYLGMASCVRERVIIGAGALIGMGAVVLSDVPPHQVWVGNPAHPLAVTE
jgi:acetyltransferase-like isoleucine patch superfamily enzyme